MVNTEIASEVTKKRLKNLTFLESEDIAEAVLYVLGTPPRVQVKLHSLSLNYMNFAKHELRLYALHTR